MSYVTAAQVKDYLGITTTTDDNLIAAIEARAEGLINAYTDRKFEAVTETRYFTSDSTDGQDLLLYGDDLLTVTKLTNGDAVEVTSANYRLFPRNSSPKWKIRLDEAYSWEWADGDSEVSVAGTWGYSATPPMDIQHATVRLAAFLYRQKDNSSDIDRPMITGDGVTIMPSNLPSDVTRLLDRYKRRIV